MDKISVIVPVWNAEPFLQRCVDSILAQTYQNLEVLLVDDGSTDSSLQICQSYADKDSRVQVFHKENGGQASARNYALDRVTGDFIGFVDDDDWIYPEMYEKLHKYLTEKDADIARCEDCFDKSEQPVEIVELTVTEHKEFFDLLFQDVWGGHVTDRLFTRKIIGTHRFPYSKTIEDMRFMRLLLPDVRREVATNEKLFFYTIRENNTSFVYARSYINSYERAVEYQDRYFEAKKKYPDCVQGLLLRATTFSCGTYRLLSKQKKEHIEEYLQIKSFLKENRREILKAKDIGLKYKVFVAILH